MKILTTTLISLCLLGSSVVFADTGSIKPYDVEQDEFWHGAEVATHHTISPSDTVSVKPYDVAQDELWHGPETVATDHTISPSDTVTVKPYDVEQDEFWFGG
jgi:hypothetical protein